MAQGREGTPAGEPVGKPSIKDIGQLKSGGSIPLSSRKGNEYAAADFAGTSALSTGGPGVQKKGSTSIAPTSGSEYRANPSKG